MRRVNSEAFKLEPTRYELRAGSEPNAPNCPFGNRYEWIGFDLKILLNRLFQKVIRTILVILTSFFGFDFSKFVYGLNT